MNYRLLRLCCAMLAGTQSACSGASSAGGSLPAAATPGSGSTGSQIAACVNGTVASYVGTSCAQGHIVYRWLSYACRSTPSNICATLGPGGSNLLMTMDPMGPNTILVGRTSLWNVGAGQSVDVVIRGTVYGSTANQNWPHFKGLRGQSGDGTEENITTVDCASSGNCLGKNNGVSDILCSTTSPVAGCTDQSSIIPYAAYAAGFNAATTANPYAFTIEIKLNGNHGTASLYSVGTHIGTLMEAGP